jgi:imidazolonepropionase-like amidohydrolase
MAYRLRGVVLPEEEEREVFVDSGDIVEGPSAAAESIVDGGWLVPGLVDVHTHPGTESPGDRFEPTRFRAHARAHADAGVLALRCPGLAARLSPDLRDDRLPVLVTAGRWLAAPGGFFAGWAREVTGDDLPRAAVEEAAAGDGWCKIIADWILPGVGRRRYGPTVPADAIRAAVDAVHAAGGRAAVHSQHAAGARAAVEAGADSLEHGMHLEEELLARMASQGTALVPTMFAFSGIPEFMATSRRPDAFSSHLLAGWRRHPALVRSAYDAGVTILAGTDDLPHGNVAAEVLQLRSAGLPPDAALGAASWTARAFLGLDGIEPGARADIVAYAADPRIDLEQLRHPTRIVLHGRVIA